MGVFLYYFPGYGSTKSQLTRDDVRRTFARESLWDVLYNANRYAQNTIANALYHGGPDNAPGTLLTCVTGNIEIEGFVPGYYPDRQTWVEVKTPDDEPAWLGWYNDSPFKPGPESLRRLWPVPGEMVELGDGELWEAPIIRTGPKASNTVTLPKVLKLLDDDSITMEPKPEFAEFLNLADDIWDSYWGIDGREMDNVEIMKSVIKCLNLNYRVSRAECRALGLLDSENIGHVFRAANNFRVIEELIAGVEKKDQSPPLDSE